MTLTVDRFGSPRIPQPVTVMRTPVKLSQEQEKRADFGLFLDVKNRSPGYLSPTIKINWYVVS
jgi:hypothetical protein